MEFRGDVPYVPQDAFEIESFVRNLDNSARSSKGKGRGKKSSYQCKKSTFPVTGTNSVTVDSWRFMDWDYKRDDLPTYARGLFTYKKKDGSPAIAIRGYDKFFNVDEVNDTRWRNVENRTRGPYELSVKENGCIIFISGLEDDVLLVCSKHSTGARQDADLSHAIAGEKWVDRHLASVGKTRQQLARELRDRNVTAVAELCDDTFEEHVLQYDEKLAGLYLHGMNLNLPEFRTYPGQLVHAFADEWGFKKAKYLMMDDLPKAQAFLESCAETGSWDGRDTEGFVIRCQKQGSESVPFEDWFFKYKFEEPYLMYRQWRECTKAVIQGKVPHYKKHAKITEEYLLYARRQLAQNKNLGKEYNKNHGIIEMRDGFLKERGLKGSDFIREEYSGNGKTADNVTNNVVLAPIATIGCGKTTVAIALTKLYDWGHIQNDNITGQRGRPLQFVTQVTHSMAQHPVVIADRNNHQTRERDQLIRDVSKVVPETRFVALHYVHDPKSQKSAAIRRITQERVLSRGDNHQTIQAGSKSNAEIIAIMDGFLDRFQGLDTSKPPDDGFDQYIDLDVSASSRENLETIIRALSNAYPKLVPFIPASEELDEAIDAALNDYEPDIKHDLSFASKNKHKEKGKRGERRDGKWGDDRQRDPRVSSHGNLNLQPKSQEVEYFAIHLGSHAVLSALGNTFATLSPELGTFYHELEKSGRVQPKFHVTLMHRANKRGEHASLWKKYQDLHDDILFTSNLPLENLDASDDRSHDPTTMARAADDNDLPPLLGKCRIMLETIVWDGRVMAIAVRLLDQGWECSNAVPHVTVGTKNPSIKPFESNALLKRWLEGGGKEVKDARVVGGAEVWGEVRGVWAR